MTSRTRDMLLLFLTLSTILCCIVGEQREQEHRRQKRGLVKMMMHVMWDPVRLIRYWYAYDVTKEIAKSWRKIIPTMVLHPFLGDTPGIAKYLHPTYGLARTNKKQTGQFNYPDGHTDDISDYIQSLVEQSESSKHAYNDPGVQHSNGYLHSLMEQSESSKNTGTSYGDRLPRPQMVLESASSSVDSNPVIYLPKFKVGHHHEHFPPETSFAVGHGGMEGHEDAHHVYLKPVLHQEFKRDNRWHLPERQSDSDVGQKFVAMPVPYPYHIGIPSSSEEQHIVLKGVPVPAFHSSAEVAGDHAASSNIDSARTKNAHSGILPEQFVSRHPGFVTIQQDAKPVSLEAGHQEIHIVLHPIPVREGDPHHGYGGQSVHFVPYNFNANKSSIAKGGHFSFALPHEPTSSHEEHSSPPLELPTKSDHLKNKSYSENKTESISAEVYDAKQTSRVTWVLKKDKSSIKPKIVDTNTDGSVTKSSVGSKDVSDHTLQHPLRLKGHRIDIEQLREDLKHGTPVLIPFDKKVNLPQNIEENTNFIRNPIGGGHLNIRGEIQYGASSNLPQGSFEVEENRTIKAPHYSSEEYIDNNSTQRLLLFLAKKHSSQYHR